jgi:hypothetical protein
MYEMLTGLVRTTATRSRFACVTSGSEAQRRLRLRLLSVQPPFYSQNLNIMYQQILNATLTFPADVALSAEAKSLLEGVRVAPSPSPSSTTLVDVEVDADLFVSGLLMIISSVLRSC